MSDDLPRLERLLEGTARRVSGGGLHPLELLQRVRAAAESSVRDSMVANDFAVRLSPADYRSYSPTFATLQEEVDGLLDEMERSRHWTRIADRTVRFEEVANVQNGVPLVQARFSDPRHRNVAAPAGATRRISRHRDLELRFADGSSMPLSHTPFSIGRGPGNDLVLPVLSVSRLHAEIVKTPTGVTIRDLGSRNGILVNGERVAEYPLEDGGRVTIGDIEFWVETK
ncbi:MAG: FhaA domain-containing protein [Tepidiformaceae bacterium]